MVTKTVTGKEKDMKNMETQLPYNLQFFAEGESEGGSEGGADQSQGSGEEGNQNNNGNQSQENNTGAKTFTQEEVNNIGAREKNQGKNSILKLFGCADEKTAKAEAEEFKKWKESQMTEDQKRTEAEKALKDTAAASEERALAAENKLTAFTAGVTKESLDDALAIALLKVTEEKNLEAVLTEMKKEPRYAGLFGNNSDSSGGTGSSANHNRGNQGKNNIGERLGKQRLNNNPQKSSFFKS